MRPLALLTSALVTLACSAQNGMDRAATERMARQGAGDMTMVDDTDPFVPNTFIGSFRMEMRPSVNGLPDGSGTRDVRYWSTPDRTLMDMQAPGKEGRPLRTLTDLKGKWTYVLMDDGQGRHIAMKGRKKKVVLNDDAAKKPEITVTDETRTIDGHACTKVIARTDKGTWTGWVARDISAPFNDLLGNAQGGAMAAWNEVQGFPLEYEWVDANGKDKLTVHVKDLKLGAVDEGVFSLDGYEVVEMPSFGR